MSIGGTLFLSITGGSIRFILIYKVEATKTRETLFLSVNQSALVLGDGLRLCIKKNKKNMYHSDIHMLAHLHL